jgi:hypothetical protein
VSILVVAIIGWLVFAQRRNKDERDKGVNPRAYQLLKKIADQTSDIADQIQKLVELRDAGNITDDEFQTLKARLMEKP